MRPPGSGLVLHFFNHQTHHRGQITDIEQRQAAFDGMVADDVIDPMASRQWLVRGLRSMPPAPARSGKKRPFVDTW